MSLGLQSRSACQSGVIFGGACGVEAAGGKVIPGPTGMSGAEADVAIAVFGVDPYAETGGILSFDMKLDKVPAGEVSLSMSCGGGCTDTVRPADHLRALVGQDWQKVAVKLACFERDSSKLADTLPFILTSEGKAEISVAHVRVLPRCRAAFTCAAE